MPVNIGDVFHGWTVEKRGVPTDAMPVTWLCRCACGAVSTPLTSYQLTSGGSKSCKSCCGKKHGLSQTGAYKSWKEMLTRCTNPNNKGWHLYGGRGIKVCDRWRKFEYFFADMGDRPKGMSIDRFPNQSGNYEPGNARWATRIEQNRNTRSNKLSESAVKEIREKAKDVRLSHGRKMAGILAAEYGVSATTIRLILRGVAWK